MTRNDKLMQDNQVIIGENLSITYSILEKKVSSLKEYTLKKLFSNIKYKEIEALHDISIVAKHGEVIGIVGDNGAGKSTLLKVLSGVIHPLGGKVIVRGRIGTILGLSAGLDPELSGRENIYLNGALLGFSRSQMNDKIQGIIDFAELEEFIDIAIRVYSDGMIARLAFAIATDIDPEVLLIDEAFSVGDVDFRSKCIERLNRFGRRGITILIVSHDHESLKEICHRVIWLEKGKLKADGNPEEVISAYRASSTKAD